MSKLAINGGQSTLKKPLQYVYNIDKNELKAVIKLIKSGPLSDFIGAKGDRFLGGKNIKQLEHLIQKKFSIRYAVSFNSATTALHAAITALGIGPGDEVIVPSYTMSASATSILMNGAVPIFADIDEKTYCIDPIDIEKKITPHTKAIMVVNLFGHPADFRQILKIAKKYKLKIIEDNAQAPGAKYYTKYTGTIGDIGVFSFNVHKVIQCGEGGILVTNNYKYALRAQMARNHGEIAADEMFDFNEPIIGSNYRMTELQAVIASCQLKKLSFLNSKRIELANYLTKKISDIPGIKTPHVDSKNIHVFYVYPIKFNEKEFGVSREFFARAMHAEGFPIGIGYVKPIYLLKLFQTKKVFNNTHFPFQYEYYKGNPNYKKGLCPVAERMYTKELLTTSICQYPYTKKHIDLFVEAIKKVYSYKN